MQASRDVQKGRNTCNKHYEHMESDEHCAGCACHATLAQLMRVIVTPMSGEALELEVAYYRLPDRAFRCPHGPGARVRSVARALLTPRGGAALIIRAVLIVIVIRAALIVIRGRHL